MRRRSNSAILKNLRWGGVALVLLAAGALTPARAADKADCPPVGTMPGYAAGDPPTLRVYAHADFTVTKGDDTDGLRAASSDYRLRPTFNTGLSRCDAACRSFS